METEKEIKLHESPTIVLDSLRINKTEKLLNTQRYSFETTAQRFKNTTAKRFSFKRENDLISIVKRIK